MHLEGDLVFEYDSDEEARDTARLIQIDNEIAPKTLKVKTAADKNMMVTTFESVKASTLFVTLDDIVFCEKLINGVLKI